MNMVIENTRQLRHDADDFVPIGADGKRRTLTTTARAAAAKLKNVEVSAQSRLGQSSTAASMVMRRAEEVRLVTPRRRGSQGSV